MVYPSSGICVSDEKINEIDLQLKMLKKDLNSKQHKLRWLKYHWKAVHSTRAFLRETVIITGNRNDLISTQTLYFSFKHWFHEVRLYEKYGKYCPSKKEMMEFMKMNGYRVNRNFLKRAKFVGDDE